VNASCALLINEYSNGTDILTAFKDLVGLFYNDTTSQCFDIYSQYVEWYITGFTQNNSKIF
jgi:hypothetical protein